jgi:hypothetical protein
MKLRRVKEFIRSKSCHLQPVDGDTKSQKKTKKKLSMKKTKHHFYSDVVITICSIKRKENFFSLFFLCLCFLFLARERRKN